MSNPQDLDLLLSGALDLSGCDLAGADISGKDLRGRNFQNANLMNAVADGTNFSDCTFGMSICVGMSAKGSICQNTNFTAAGLNRASLQGANLTGSLFPGTFLVDVDFSKADLSDADFSRARFVGSTDFVDAVVSPATNFEGAIGGRPLSRLEAFRYFDYVDGRFKRRVATVALSGSSNIRVGGTGGLTAAAGEL